jgi:hypothetical protein
MFWSATFRSLRRAKFGRLANVSGTLDWWKRKRHECRAADAEFAGTVAVAAEAAAGEGTRLQLGFETPARQACR